MTDISDILSCDQLDAAVKQQQQHVSQLGSQVAKATAATKTKHQQIAEAEKEYREFKEQFRPQVEAAFSKLLSTPQSAPGQKVTTKDLKYSKVLDEHNSAKAHLDKGMTAHENNIDCLRWDEEQLLKWQREFEAELATAKQGLAELEAAAARCKTKKTSALVGGILVAIGVGLAVLGFNLVHSGNSKVIDTHSASDSHSIVAPVAPLGGGVAPSSAPGGTSSPKYVKPTKNIMDEELGEEPKPTPPQPPKTDKTSNDDSSTVNTGDADATGSDSSSDSSYEVSDSGGNSTVGNDSHNSSDEPQHSDEPRDNETQERPHEERPSQERPHEERPADR